MGSREKNTQTKSHIMYYPCDIYLNYLIPLNFYFLGFKAKIIKIHHRYILKMNEANIWVLLNSTELIIVLY